MRRILLSLLSALLLSGVARAQIPVTDAANITQSIVNSVTELVQTSTTAENMIGNFKETMKIYRQGKEYYDRLRNVTQARSITTACAMSRTLSGTPVRFSSPFYWSGNSRTST